MLNLIGCGTVVLAVISFIAQLAFADSFAFFDYNDLAPVNKKSKNHFVNIEAYMEGVYGSDITVKPGVRVTPGFGGPFAVSSTPLDMSLMNGLGKKAPIVLNFNSAPIDSFAIDFHLFKRGRGITILCDSEVIYQHFLTKEEKRKGTLSQLGPCFFDRSVQTLEFRASKRSRFSIDNLAINLPDPYYDGNGGNDDGSPGTYPGGDGDNAGGKGPNYNPTDPPAGQLSGPSSLLMLATGLFGFFIATRRINIRRNRPKSADTPSGF